MDLIGKGAITSSILGALLGADAIPSAWPDRLELREEIGTIATHLHTRFRGDAAWRRKYSGC